MRFGGDEFAVLLPGVTRKDALSIAERVRTAVSGDTEASQDSMIQIPVNVSMGVAELESHGTLDSLLRAADAALYRAKNAGRNSVSD